MCWWASTRSDAPPQMRRPVGAAAVGPLGFTISSRDQPASRGGTRVLLGACHCREGKWQVGGQPDAATACNCTVCRRYGVLWAYDYEGEGIKTSGATRCYIRGEAI